MKATSPYTCLQLSNGLRIVHVARRTVAEYFGVTVRAGSRNNPADKPGMAHFVEHTIFKGTTRRRSHHIINRMERIGGELNAYTTKETTTVYTVFPSGHLKRAVELVADLVINSTFPTAEINKEKEVIADEIESYLDTPSEAVYDDFEDLVFKNSSLGHNILGTRDALATFTSADCRDFLTSRYTASEMVVFYLGPCSPERLQTHVESFFAGIRDGSAPDIDTSAPPSPPFNIRRANMATHQAHTIIGATLPGLYSDQRFAYNLLNNILGGPGMNSLLNINLRERRGLVYAVESSLNLYTDHGLMSIYYGCDPADSDRCYSLVKKQIIDLAEKPLSDRALSMAKRQYLGQLKVASSSNEQTALSAARTCLFRNRVVDNDTIAAHIEAITPEVLRQIAESLISGNLSSLTFG